MRCWILRYGFAAVILVMLVGIKPQVPTLAQSGQCDKAYPDVCIPSPPPELDCKNISHRNFKVLRPDPHRFDRDKDGIGCEQKSSKR
ncbi:MAG: excalibur calcium-binding domain-containing protein [Leptolyngbyaceae cyanobacterium bins.302]|nr:excalibur calcium-binding domain-containing protein [Leptolyngbyaceae cyanobacterium bins.302]